MKFRQKIGTGDIVGVFHPALGLQLGGIGKHHLI